MKQRAKRLMALFMAGVFALSTCMTSGPYTVMATEAGTAGVTTPSEGTPTTPSQGSTTTPDNTTPSGTPEEGGTTDPEPEAPTQHIYNVKLPEKIKDVDWGNLQVTYGEEKVSVTAENTIALNNVLTDSSAVGIKSDNYSFADITVNDGTINVATATPKLSNPEVKGERTTLSIDEKGEYSISNIPDVWKDKVTWSVQPGAENITTDGVSLEEQEDHTKIKVIVSKEGYEGANEKPEILVAHIGEVQIGTFNFNVTKKNPELSLKANPEPPAGWKTEIKLLVSGQKDFNKKVIVSDENGQTQEVAVKNGKAEEINWNLSYWTKDYKFVVTYAGDKVYKSESISLAYNVDKETQQFELTQSAEQEDITYGGSEKQIASIAGTKSSGIHPWNYSYEWENGNNGGAAIRVDGEKLLFTPGQAGTYKVTIKRSSEDYNEQSYTLAITVKKKTLNIKDVAAENRAYDGTNEVKVTAKFNEDDFATEADKALAAGLSLQTKGIAKDINANEEKPTKVTYEFGFPANTDQSIVNNYQLEGKGETTVTIGKKTLKLKVCTSDGEALEREYTDYKELSEAKDVYVEVTGFADTDLDADREVSEQLKKDHYKAPNVVVDAETVKDGFVEIGAVIDNALVPENKSGCATKNYRFDFDDVEKAGLKLTERSISDEEWKELLMVNNDSSVKAYQKDAESFMYYGVSDKDDKDAPSVSWKIDISNLSDVSKTTDLYTGYDTVQIWNKNEKKWETKNSYTPANNEELDTITVRLVRIVDDNVVEATESQDISLHKDAVDPSADIKIGNDASVYTLGSVITFGIFKNTHVAAETKVADDQSGVSKWTYYKVNLKTDPKFEDTSEEGIINELLANANSCIKENFTTEDGKKDTLDRAGNFVVFALVEDHVGNKALYGSNGTVIDLTNPDSVQWIYDEGEVVTRNIEVTKPDQPEETETHTVDFLQKGSQEAVLHAVVKDAIKDNVGNDTAYSGIKEVHVSITDDEQGKTYTDKIYPSETSSSETSPNTTLDDLFKNYVEATTDKIKKTTKENECVKYEIKLTVIDYAGNELVTNLENALQKELVLDTLAPELTKNNIYLTNDPTAAVKTMGDGENVTYYSNEDVTIQTAVKERFTDLANIQMTLVKDGTETTKTLSEWLSDKTYKVEVNETGADINSNDSTRIISFTVPATGLENKFSYYVSAKDYSGNETTNDAINFVVDNVKPEISDNTIQNSTDDHFDNKADINTKVYYSNEDVVVKTEVKDRFIDAKHITISLTKDKKEYTKSVEEWCENLDLGIKCEYKEPDDNKDASVVRTITFTVPKKYNEKDNEKDNEGDFTYKVSAVDYAENQAENQTINFCIDTTKPEVEVTYSPIQNGKTLAPINTSNSIYYLNQNYDEFKVNVKVIEKHLKANDTNVILSDYQAIRTYRVKGDIDPNPPEEDIPVSASRKGSTSEINLQTGIIDDIKGKESWLENPENSIEYNYTFTCTKEANYEFPDITITDLAGNPSGATGNAKITLDRTVPEGTVTISDLISTSGKETSWTNRFLDSLTFGLYGKTFVTASISNHDETTGGSGIGEKKYYLATSRMTKEALNQLNENQWTSYRGNITMAENRNYIVYEKVVDKAGNLAYYSSDRVIVDDQNPQPEVTITPTTPGWGKGVYSASDNPGFDVYVVDPAGSDGSCAGLAEIKCTITDRTTGHSKPVPLASFSATSAPEATYRTHVSIDPAEFYSNEVQVTVEAKDHSTNPATVESQVIKIDNKAPIVTFSFDKSDVHNGKYYNNDKTLTITVDERNFDESYKPQVTSTAGGGYSISGWSHNGEIHTATVTFSGDSDYTVTYDCYDLAGNKSNTEKLEEFTVDKTKPAIQVSYDNNNALNNDYYKDARTATITITEHNFNPGEVTVTTTAQLDGAPVAAPGVSGWSGSGDTHVATVSYSADADYTFTISATDLASNVSEPYVTDNFTVDQTKPTVEITNIEDHSANNGEVAPVVTLNDINFDSSKTVVHLTGANKGEVDTTGMYTSAATAKGQTLTFHNFAENMDDIYTLTAEATDKAGNVYSTSKMFSVNRDGSTYMYDSYTDELIKNGYTNDPKNLVVSEINVDTLTFQELTVTENGTLKTLEQDKDYEVKESGSEVSWKEYKYTINASNFEGEGDYNVSIYSEDRATNVTTNTSKSKDILFAVDKTSPVIALSNIEDGGRYKVESQKFTANVDDNMALDKVEYYVDGKLQQTFDASEVAAQSGSLELSVDSSSKFQKVSVKAYDKANNEATSADADVLVSASSWVQFYNNKPAFYGTIGGGVAVLAAAVAAGVHFSGAGAAAGTAGAAGAGGFFFLAGKKKKDEEETK